MEAETFNAALVPSTAKHPIGSRWLVLLAASLTSFTLGCQSIAQHAQGHPANPIRSKEPLHGLYYGVQGDAIMISAPFRKSYMNDPQGPYNYLGCPYACFDLPFSFVLDTVLMPYDLAKGDPDKAPAKQN